MAFTIKVNSQTHSVDIGGHFHWAKSGDYVTQVTAIDPLGLEYLNRDVPEGRSPIRDRNKSQRSFYALPARASLGRDDDVPLAYAQAAPPLESARLGVDRRI
jgi:hypothetical protein